LIRTFTLFLVLSFFLFSHVGAQYEDITLDDYVYVTNIKSVSFYPTGNQLEPPIVYLGNRQNLFLSFDDMDNVQKARSDMDNIGQLPTRSVRRNGSR